MVDFVEVARPKKELPGTGTVVTVADKDVALLIVDGSDCVDTHAVRELMEK